MKTRKTILIGIKDKYGSLYYHYKWLPNGKLMTCLSNMKYRYITDNKNGNVLIFDSIDDIKNKFFKNYPYLDLDNILIKGDIF